MLIITQLVIFEVWNQSDLKVKFQQAIPKLLNVTIREKRGLKTENSELLNVERHEREHVIQLNDSFHSYLRYYENSYDLIESYIKNGKL